MMKMKDLRKKNEGELGKLLVEFCEELQEFRFGMTGAAKKNVRHARTLRADIARIKTLLNKAK